MPVRPTLASLLALALAACGREREAEPSASEVVAYTVQIEKNAVAAKADDVRKSRAREQARDADHSRRMDVHDKQEGK
jgi:hypothetical protein